MLTVSKRKLSYILFSLVLVIVNSVLVLLLRNSISSDVFIPLTVITAFFIVLFETIAISRLSKSFLNPSIVFLMVYYLFQNGQLLLLALGIDFNRYYINTLYSYTDDVVLFSSISTMIAGLAGVICTNINPKKTHGKISAVDRYDSKSVCQAAFFGFIITGTVATVLMVMKFPYGLSGGYSSVRAFESTVSPILNFAEYMFMPFCILCLVFETKHSKRNFVMCVSILWLIFTTVFGDRTVGIAGLFIIFFVGFQKDAVNLKKQRKSFLKICVVGVALVFLTKIVSVIRIQGNFVWTSLLETMINFISELGFSCFPLFTVMYLVPASEPFQYGVGYLSSLITGFIPSFLDPTGTVSSLFQKSDIIQTWHHRYFGQYNFGLGSSLNAEAYANWGWYGLFFLFLLCIVIFSFLGMSSLKEIREKRGWKLYITCVLLFLWFTLPRRHSYYVWKAIAYGLLFMRFYLWLFISKNRVRGK